MELNEQQLTDIENFAYLYMSKAEIAIIVEIPFGEFTDPDSKAFTAFQKGRLKRKAEYNGAVINLTKQLSSPAMAIEREIAQAAYLNDLR